MLVAENAVQFRSLAEPRDVVLRPSSLTNRLNHQLPLLSLGGVDAEIGSRPGYSFEKLLALEILA